MSWTEYDAQTDWTNEGGSTAQVTHIAGRRWFQRSYGNTYHTVTLFYGDGATVKSEPRYGYGDAYLQTAFDMMGLPYGGTRVLREELGITHDVSDVERERDL
jgi:hypothetical protein